MCIRIAARGRGSGGQSGPSDMESTQKCVHGTAQHSRKGAFRHVNETLGTYREAASCNTTRSRIWLRRKTSSGLPQAMARRRMRASCLEETGVATAKESRQVTRSRCKRSREMASSFCPPALQRRAQKASGGSQAKRSDKRFTHFTGGAAAAPASTSAAVSLPSSATPMPVMVLPRPSSRPLPQSLASATAAAPWWRVRATKYRLADKSAPST